MSKGGLEGLHRHTCACPGGRRTLRAPCLLAALASPVAASLIPLRRILQHAEGQGLGGQRGEGSSSFCSSTSKPSATSKANWKTTSRMAIRQLSRKRGDGSASW